MSQNLPDNVQANDDPAQDLEKQFGLRAILTYTDGSTEYHYTAFNPDVRGWQFASCTIVPKQPGKTVQTIRVVCAFEKNCNVAYFDNLSLTREVAQTMRYDADGNLVSVKSTGKTEETAAFENGNLISVNTGGSGTFTYTYDGNHNVTRASNGVIRQDYTYDAMGNVTGTSLTADSGSGSALTSSATYTNGGNLLASATDGTGQTLTYAYGTALSKMTGQATTVTDALENSIQTAYNDLGRVTQKTFANGGDLDYNYDKGLLETITRTDSAGGSQSIACDYDAFGNLTGVSVGGLLLASYQYGAKNGLLAKQTYGNGEEIEFEYDRLGRTTRASYSSGRTLTYAYNGDGQLYSIHDNAGTAAANDDVTYFYTYDSLKRAISCQMYRGIAQLLSVRWEYDDSSRVKSQAWQMGQQSYEETYTYSATDGNLTGITRSGGGNSLQLSYDSLSRLASAGNGIYTRSYTYRDISSTQTTTQVQSLGYTGLSGALSGLTYNYTYNALGNIASVAKGSGTATTYTYDSMGQLTGANLPGLTCAYTYDGAGNLLTASDGTTTNTYTYGNASWKDLLTAFNGEKIVYEGQTLDENGSVTGTPTSGNPTSYYNGTRWNFGWSEGRNLTQAVRRSSQERVFLSNKYDGNGLRISKSVTMTAYEPNDGTVANPPIANEETINHSYIYAGGKLLRETITEGSMTKTLDFTYDNVGMPYSLIYNSGTTTTTYYYITNLQGDVMYLVDASGNEVAAYDYDPYGKIISATGELAGINPLRYRGYYYDTETDFYYLQSRYYDPEICRFINGDKYSATATGYLGYNMFAYCNNNPIIAADYDGEWLNIVIGAVVGAVVGALTTAVEAYKSDGWDAFSSGKTWAKMGVSAAIGAVSGGIAATGLGMFAQAGISAATATVGDIATQMIDNGEFCLSPKKIDYSRALHNGVVAGGMSIVGSVTGGLLSSTKLSKGNSLVSAGLDKYLKGSARELTGKSSSSLLRSGAKLVFQGTRMINTARGISSVAGTLLTWGASVKYTVS